MSTLSYAFRRDNEFELGLVRAANALEARAPAGPARWLEGELYGEYQVPPPRRRVVLFHSPPADLAQVRAAVGRPVTAAQLQAALESIAGRAVRLIRNAARALRARSAATRLLFFEAFAVPPEFVPPWRATLRGNVRWRDLGELVAIRLESAAGLLDGGRIRYFVWHTAANCPECAGLGANDLFACSSFRGRHVICLGRPFWEEWARNQLSWAASTLLHEALHIFYGTTIAHEGRTGNANCYQRFMLRSNGLLVRPVTGTRCQAGRVIDRFAQNSAVLSPRQVTEAGQIAGHIDLLGPSVARGIRLIGHTDNTGTRDYNRGLGLRRAQAVRQALRAALDRLRPGLSGRFRWAVESRGERAPAVPNDSEANRARNRRVQVLLER